MLLPSGPDTVHESPLRGTRSSTSPWRAAFENGDLGREFSPAGADCRFRAPLVPRLARRSKDSRGGGEGGIRTRDGLPHTAFPVRRPRPLGDLSTGPGADGLRPPSEMTRMAERVGFEPTVLSHTAFRERHLKPLGHLSAREDTKGHRSGPRSATTAAGGRAAVELAQPRCRGCMPQQPPLPPTEASQSSASSWRMPLTTRSRCRSPGLWARSTTEPAAPSIRLGTA